MNPAWFGPLIPGPINECLPSQNCRTSWAILTSERQGVSTYWNLESDFVGYWGVALWRCNGHRWFAMSWTLARPTTMCSNAAAQRQDDYGMMVSAGFQDSGKLKQSFARNSVCVVQFRCCSSMCVHAGIPVHIDVYVHMPTYDSPNPEEKATSVCTTRKHKNQTT
jgi:hypothetical protein